jgi:hypothetical protein
MQISREKMVERAGRKREVFGKTFESGRGRLTTLERLSNEPGKTSQPWFMGVLCVEGCGWFEDELFSEPEAFFRPRDRASTTTG